MLRPTVTLTLCLKNSQANNEFYVSGNSSNEISPTMYQRHSMVSRKYPLLIQALLKDCDIYNSSHSENYITIATEADISPDADDDPESAYERLAEMCCFSGYVNTLMYLLENRLISNPDRLVMYSVQFNNINTLKSLVEAKCSVEQRVGRYGETPLYYAWRNNLFTISEYLLSIGANPIVNSKARDAEVIMNDLISEREIIEFLKDSQRGIQV